MTNCVSLSALAASLLITTSIALHAQAPSKRELTPLLSINDSELNDYAWKFFFLVTRLRGQDQPDQSAASPNYVLISEEGSLADGRIQSKVAEEIFSRRLLDFVSKLEVGSDRCKIIPIRQTLPDELEVLVFIDESNSTPTGRKNCFLVSLVVAYELEIDWTEYKGDTRKSLEIDVLTHIAGENPTYR